MGQLTVEQVNAISASITSRAGAVIDGLEDKKTVMGSIFGNNDTITSTQGAIRMIRDKQIPPWREEGISIATNDLDDRISKWKDVGTEFVNAISAIDGYGKDASLESVVVATGEQTVTDVGHAAASVAGAIPFKVWAAVGIAAGIVGLVVLLPYVKRG
jgi:hypothetical protein